MLHLTHRFAVKPACRYPLTAERAIEAFPAGVSAEKTIEYRFLKRCRPKREHTEPRVSAASRRSDATRDGDWARPRSVLARGRWWGFPFHRSFTNTDNRYLFPLILQPDRRSPLVMIAMYARYVRCNLRQFLRWYRPIRSWSAPRSCRQLP